MSNVSLVSHSMTDLMFLWLLHLDISIVNTHGKVQPWLNFSAG